MDAASEAVSLTACTARKQSESCIPRTLWLLHGHLANTFSRVLGSAFPVLCPPPVTADDIAVLSRTPTDLVLSLNPPSPVAHTTQTHSHGLPPDAYRLHRPPVSPHLQRLHRAVGLDKISWVIEEPTLSCNPLNKRIQLCLKAAQVVCPYSSCLRASLLWWLKTFPFPA